MIPWDFPCGYHSLMGNRVVLFVPLIATMARLLGPGGVRSIVAESLLLKHQLLIAAMHSKQTFAYSLRSLIICECQVFYWGIDDDWRPKALCYPLFLRE